MLFQKRNQETKEERRKYTSLSSMIVYFVVAAIATTLMYLYVNNFFAEMTIRFVNEAESTDIERAIRAVKTFNNVFSGIFLTITIFISGIVGSFLTEVKIRREETSSE